MNNKKNQESQNTNFNFPNFLILIRFFLAIIVIIMLMFVPYSIDQGFYFVIFNSKVSWINIIALILFIFASFTDWLDGYLARKNNKVTNFGKFFDPIADKILINSVLAFFVLYLYIPIWIFIILFIRDILVDGLRMNLALKEKALAANRYGKLKTLFQMLSIVIIFIFHPSPNSQGNYDYTSLQNLWLIPLYLALFFSVYSGVNYFIKNIEYIV